MVRLYQMYDRVSESVVGPIIADRVDASAIRTFYLVLADPKTQPGQYPSDFVLLLLGEQEEGGRLVPVFGDLSPVTIATGEQWLVSQSQIKEASNGSR